MQLAVVHRRATQFHAQRTGAGSHHRPGVGAIPQRALFAPADQGQTGLAQQGISQGHQPRRYIVEHIVDARRAPAKALEAFVSIAPHGIQRVAEAVQHHAGRTGHHKPEQRGEYCIAAVLQHRLGRRSGHCWLVQFARFAADQVANPAPRLRQIALAQSVGHRQHMLAQAAQPHGAVKRQYVNQPADIWQPRKDQRHQGQRHHRQKPRTHAVATPAAPASIQTALKVASHIAEGHQGVAALWFAQQRVQGHPGHGQQGHAH